MAGRSSSGCCCWTPSAARTPHPSFGRPLTCTASAALCSSKLAPRALLHVAARPKWRREPLPGTPRYRGACAGSGSSVTEEAPNPSPCNRIFIKVVCPFPGLINHNGMPKSGVDETRAYLLIHSKPSSHHYRIAILFPILQCVFLPQAVSWNIPLQPSECHDAGLPNSTSEGALVKVFSQFGDVTRVKVITSKISKQSLGIAYVWFAFEEDAHLAVKEMDGKFVDGRFIYVTIAKPESPTRQVRATPYKF